LDSPDFRQLPCLRTACYFCFDVALDVNSCIADSHRQWFGPVFWLALFLSVQRPRLASRPDFRFLLVLGRWPSFVAHGFCLYRSTVLDIRFSRVLDLWLLFGLNPILRSRPLSGCTVLLLPRPSGLLRSRPSGLSRAVTFSAFVFGLAERSGTEQIWELP
jgi:hypothetical protein